MASTGRPVRMHYIDYIRAFIVMLVIVLHAAVAYLSFYPYKWVVVDSRCSSICDYVVLGSEYFVMAVLFFIAGYLMPPSLEKQGPARYARSRLQRLGIPFLIGLGVMCPVMTYVRELGRGRDPGSYIGYWLTTYFQGKIYAGYMWFLSTLLAFMLAACLAWRLFPGVRSWFQLRPATPDASRLLTGPGLLAMAAAIGLCMFGINLFMPDSHWVRFWQKGVIIFQPTRLPLYAGFFLWGIMACRRNWHFLHDHDSPGQIWPWAAGSAICLYAYISLLQLYSETAASPVLQRLALCLLRAVGPLCLTMLLIAVFKKRLGRPTAWKNLLAANSYGMYVAHIPFVVTLQHMLQQADLSAPVKFALIAGISLPLSFIASHFILRRLPGIGKYF